MNPFSILKYQIYLLQLENYELKRFWKLLRQKGYLKAQGPQRKDLVWTAKAKLIFLISLLIWVGLSLLFANLNLYIAIFLAVLMLLFFPVFYTITILILWPIDFISKQLIINKAKKLLSNISNLKVIGIAGSYGKTTMKSALETVLSVKYNILATPESINTPLGIANWLLKNFKKNTQILIVEMGEHYRGDVKYLCKLTPPEITIVTGISEAHFERLGSLDNTAATIFEAVEGSKGDAKIYLNSDDENIMKYYERYIGSRGIKFFDRNNPGIKNKKFDQQKLSWIAEVDDVGKIEIPFLAEYIFADLDAAISIAKYLDLSFEEIKRGILGLKTVEHRLQPIKGEGNVLVIDDSYNSNPVGVKEAINVLSRFNERRKLYITPGVVETGDSNKRVHTEIGCQLAGVADIVILIKNSATPYIAEGLIQSGFDKKNIIWFDTATEAHNSLGQILKPNDVILFQNDWGDQYL